MSSVLRNTFTFSLLFFFLERKEKEKFTFFSFASSLSQQSLDWTEILFCWKSILKWSRQWTKKQNRTKQTRKKCSSAESILIFQSSQRRANNCLTIFSSFRRKCVACYDNIAPQRIFACFFKSLPSLSLFLSLFSSLFLSLSRPRSYTHLDPTNGQA